MHHLIEEMILSFTREELREFKYFLKGRANMVQEREDVRLVDAIRKKIPSSSQSSNAYHQTRKRLKRQLELFVQLENTKHDANSGILNDVEVARFFFRKERYKEAWNYLGKAEKSAHETESFELLDYIYYTQIDYALGTWPLTAPSVSVPALLAKRDRNVVLAKSNGDANAAYTLLLFEISELFSKEVFGNIDAIIERVLKQYQLEDRIYDNPKVYAKIVSMVCRAFREKKDYEGLKIYSVKSYGVMQRRRMLDKVPPELLMELLRSIYQSSVRTYDYKVAIKFSRVYETQKENFKAQHDKYIYFDFRSQIMAADLNMFTGKVKEAKSILLRLDKKYSLENKNAIIYFLLRINLLALYFKLNDYDRCIRIYSGLLQQYGKQVLREEGLGLEMLLFTELYGLIFYFEKGDDEYVLYLLKRIKRKYGGASHTKNVEREMLFLRILERMIKHEGYKGSDKFKVDYRHFVSLKKYIPGDKEYISLNAWLESKYTGSSYYDCFQKSIL
ncbi:MAG: hypothetical protein V4590_08845 [Bacteroidota bacterium]